MELGKIKLEKLRDLKLSEKTFVSAASGLIKVESDFCVVSDDELGVFLFSPASEKDTKFSSLREGSLPEEHKARKALKPDWESLALLPDGSILVVPSGSKPNRQLGFQIKFNAGKLIAKTEIDFSPLYDFLNSQMEDLNIEGAVVHRSLLKLFQRGNGSQGKNAVIDLNLARVLRDISQFRKIPSEGVFVKTIDLGLIGKAKLSFTDACTYEDQVYFLAAAEETASTYDDGKYCGAVLGLLNSQNEVEKMWDLDCPFKPEGLWIEQNAEGLRCYVVTDADDRSQSSGLYSGSFQSTQKN